MPGGTLGDVVQDPMAIMPGLKKSKGTQMPAVGLSGPVFNLPVAFID